MKCTNEQYARALLLRLLQRGPLRARDVMAVMEENALADVARDAMAGLGVAEFKHGDLIFALPPNVVGFFPLRGVLTPIAFPEPLAAEATPLDFKRQHGKFFRATQINEETA